jgi:hypothetical protein
MENSSDKRRKHFFDLWGKKKQASPKFNIRSQSGILLAGHKQRFDFKHTTDSPRDSSSSSSQSDTDSSSRTENERFHRSRQRHNASPDHGKKMYSPQLQTHVRYEEQEYSNHNDLHLDNEGTGRIHYSSIDPHTISREKLFTLSPRKLRELSSTLGLDYRQSQKAELVESIYQHIYQHGLNTRKDTVLVPDKMTKERIAISATNDDWNQMTILLREIIPFYGQGDVKTDITVRQTIAKLPNIYLDMPDPRFGNTILMHCIQNGVLDLVALLLQKGCDPNIPNHDGSIGLHFLCNPDSNQSLDVAQVSPKPFIMPHVK